MRQRRLLLCSCAPTGGASGAHELAHIHASMHNPRPVGIQSCQTAYYGEMTGRDGRKFAALAVTTGIGFMSSTACTTSLLRYSSYEPTSVVFLGTSGFSPFKGGFNPLDTVSGCDPLSAAVEKNAIGSVCVTSGSLILESGSCIETLEKSQCARPNCFLFDEGSVLNRIVANSSLSDAIRETNKDAKFPTMPPIVAEGLRKWWGANEMAEDSTAPAEPHLVQCAEATMNAITAGAQHDYLCREYIARTMKLPMSESVCVQAMEGIGFLRAMMKFPHIPVAIVRTASNYDMYQ